MALDFKYDGCENMFRDALTSGINLFCGAGFSVEASDARGQKLPVGSEMLEELKKRFSDDRLDLYSDLSKACDKLKRTRQTDFYTYIENRFSVKDFNEAYLNLKNINIKNIYTTNVDDLFYAIYKHKDLAPLYLVDRNKRGTVFADNYAVQFAALHGCVKTEKDYVFGATEIASAYQKEGAGNIWQELTNDAVRHPILFWGWNFEDSDMLQAFFSGKNNIEDNSRKWVLLRSENLEMIDYLQSFGFHIIIGDTLSMLDYLSSIDKTNQDAPLEDELIDPKGRFSSFLIPQNNEKLPSLSLETFFVELEPHWSHIYSERIPKTHWYAILSEVIASGKNVIVTGIRGAGKTTLMMQLLVAASSSTPKHYMVAPTEESMLSYLKSLNGKKTLLFVDSCFSDTNAVIAALKDSHVQAVLFDRDYNYEMQSHKIENYSELFDSIDISEIDLSDAQKIINAIPTRTKFQNANTRFIERDPTIPHLLLSSLRKNSFNYMRDFYEDDPEAAMLFLMICYVHSCGVPCSFDMIFSFLSDEGCSWKEMYERLDRVGNLVRNYFGAGSILDQSLQEQDYYECRSRLFAEKILRSLGNGNSKFAEMLERFAENVPTFKIYRYDYFKRSAYDATLAFQAFNSDIERGERYYEICAKKDESEYIYQQAALFFEKNKNYKKAFEWVDRARGVAHNKFTVESTYAQIAFRANVDVDSVLAEEALDILEDCCRKDRRKVIHFKMYAEFTLQYVNKYGINNGKRFVANAKEFIEEALAMEDKKVNPRYKYKLRHLLNKLKHFNDA